jgi:hypothetical protein
MPGLKAQVTEWCAKLGFFSSDSIKACLINGEPQFWQ